MSKEISLFEKVQEILEMQRKDIFDITVGEPTTSVSKNTVKPLHLEPMSVDLLSHFNSEFEKMKFKFYSGMKCVIDTFGILAPGENHVMVISEKLHEELKKGNK